MIDRYLQLRSILFFKKHKRGKLNQVADALSRRIHLLVTIQNESVAFDFLKDINPDDDEFKIMWVKCSSCSHGTNVFFVHYNFLFKWHPSLHYSIFFTHSSYS